MRSIRHRFLPSATLAAVSIWILSCCLSSQNNDHSNHYDVSRLLTVYNRFGHAVSDRYQFVFVDIPQTGGRLISKSVLLDDTYGPTAPFTIDTIYNAMSVSARSSYYKTAVIRHPCSRFVETFRFLHAAYLGRITVSGAVGRTFARFPDLFENVRDVNDFAMKLTITKQWDKLEQHFFHFYTLTSYTFLSNGEFGLDSVICDEDPQVGLQKVQQHLSSLTTSNDGAHQPLLEAFQNQLSAAPDLCQDLPLTTRKLIATHYALDLCVFGYDSTILGASKCLGDTLQKEDFTARYQSCKAKIAQQQEEQHVKEYDYAYLQQIKEESEDEPYILDIPLQ